MDNNNTWNRARMDLITALSVLGYPTELADIIAEHIGSPKGIERMIAYLDYVKPVKVELIVDEMLAIKSEVDRWREKKEFESANSAYNIVLNNGLGTQDDEYDR
ncbi:MAG: hypothetical protein J5956_06675 [Ruminococcus sp.]|nr:hypothetical protein [Ruminococcus sp.]